MLHYGSIILMVIEISRKMLFISTSLHASFLGALKNISFLISREFILWYFGFACNFSQKLKQKETQQCITSSVS